MIKANIYNINTHKNVYHDISGYAKLRYIDGHIRRSSSIVSDVRALVHHTDDSEDENDHGGLSCSRTKGST